MPIIPQIAFPPHIVNGQLLEIEQGSPDDVAGQVHLLCLTPPGWLSSQPDMGLEDQAHLTGGADLQEIEQQIDTFVPDAVFVLSEDATALDRGLEVIGVRIAAGA